jgi:hypothetical protein
MRAIALLTLFGITLSSLVACSGTKNAANNAAQTAASAAGAMGNAAQNAGQTAGQAAGSAAGAMANGAQNTAGAMGSAAQGAAAAMTKPNCGAVQAVWVNLKSKAYHEPGDPWYGKGTHGKFLCPSQAQAQGFHPAGRRGASSSSM